MEELQEVPFISNSKVLNRLILYSNQILNTKIGKDNLCLTTKNNVSKYSLEYEIENTIKNNIDVVFHTIQYDEKNKRLYFYTNEELIIEIKKRKEKQTKYIKEFSIAEYYKKIMDDLYSFKEPKEIYMIPLENDSTISLKDVIEIIENKNKEIKEFINNTNASLSNNFKIYLNNNRENKLFEIEKELYNIYYEIIGKKVFLLSYDNNNLNTTLSLKHLKNIKEEIETIVEKSAFFLKYTNKETTINSINSNYQINIHKDSLKITISDTTTDFNYTIDFDNDIKTECKSFELYNLITSIEINEIYKNIYFYRKQFPEWMQEEWEKNNNIGIEKQEEVKQNTKKHFFKF